MSPGKKSTGQLFLVYGDDDYRVTSKARELADSIIPQEDQLTALEVIEADTNLKDAQTNYYNALYNAIISKIELQKALGILK